MRHISILLFVLLTTVANANTETLMSYGGGEITTILVVDGKALLVDVDRDGKVVREYMEVPEYFSSNKKHEEKVEAAKKKYEILKKHQIDQIRFIAFDQSFTTLDEAAMRHIIDVANHYAQTYANQVTITAAKRSGNNDLLDKLINDVKFVLKGYGVNENDINVVYKKDKGDMDLQFVKVMSNLR